MPKSADPRPTAWTARVWRVGTGAVLLAALLAVSGPLSPGGTSDAVAARPARPAPLPVPAVSGTGAGVATAAALPPIVWIALDELPLGALLTADGTVDAHLYPGFARLAALSTWYPRARTFAPATRLAMPSLLTGRLPGAGDTPATGPQVSGYFAPRVPFTGERPGCRSGATCLPAHQPAGPSACPGAPWCAQTARLWGWHRMLASITPATAGRGVWYEHVVMPHAPWHVLDDGREYLPRGAAQTFQTDSALRFATDAQGQRIYTQSYWTGQDAHVAVLNQAHQIQLAAVDAMITRTLDAVTAGGHLAETMIVVTADHGIAFVPHESGRAIRRAPRSLAQVLSVPLFIKYPHQTRGVVDPREANIIDVLPTILDVARVTPTTPVDGRSLAGPTGPTRRIPLAGFQVPGGTVPTGPVNLAVLTGWRQQFTRLTGVRDLYRPGRHGQLVGRKLRDLTRGTPTALTATLESPIPTQLLTPNLVPALAYGKVEGAERGDTVVVAVDGVVAGVGAIWMDPFTPRFQIILDPRLVRGASVTVATYLIKAGRTTLAPLALTGGRSTLPVR